MKLKIEEFELSLNLGNIMIGESLNGLLKEQLSDNFCPNQVQKAIRRYGIMMLYMGYSKGISVVEHVKFKLDEHIIQSKIDMPDYPYWKHHEEEGGKNG